MYLILQCYCNKYAVNTTCDHILLECIPVYFSIFVTYVMCCVGDCSTDFNHIWYDVKMNAYECCVHYWFAYVTHIV